MRIMPHMYNNIMRRYLRSEPGSEAAQQLSINLVLVSLGAPPPAPQSAVAA